MPSTTVVAQGGRGDARDREHKGWSGALASLLSTEARRAQRGKGGTAQQQSSVRWLGGITYEPNVTYYKVAETVRAQSAGYYIQTNKRCCNE
jgi:hypothetical protein